MSLHSETDRWGWAVSPGVGVGLGSVSRRQRGEEPIGAIIYQRVKYLLKYSSRLFWKPNIGYKKGYPFGALKIETLEHWLRH